MEQENNTLKTLLSWDIGAEEKSERDRENRRWRDFVLEVTMKHPVVDDYVKWNQNAGFQIRRISL